MSSLLRDMELGALALSRGLISHDQLCASLHELGKRGGNTPLLTLMQEMGFLGPAGVIQIEGEGSSDGRHPKKNKPEVEAFPSDGLTVREESSRAASTAPGTAVSMKPPGNSHIGATAMTQPGLAGTMREGRPTGEAVPVDLAGRGHFSDLSQGPNRFGSPDTFGAEFKYRFGKEVGIGGNGVVTLVYDTSMGRRLALKTLRAGPTATPRQVERFIEEVQITGQLEHPNIVPVHELGKLPNGEVYFTMKLVEGKTLEYVIRGLRRGYASIRNQYGRLRLLNILQQVCQAVGYANSKGVVHRDLKPANIMLGEYGEVLVMDWGLAKVRGCPDGTDEGLHRGVRTLRTVRSASATLHGTVKGTPAYMAPEQARGQVSQIDERSDVYSIGTILYECLTLKRPHEGTEALEVIRAVAKDPIQPPRERAPEQGIPEELEVIVMRCLEKDPKKRYSTTLAIHQDIENFLEGTKRRKLAQAKVEDAQRMTSLYEGRKADVGELQRALRESQKKLSPWDPVEEKRPMWGIQQEITRTEVEAIDALGEALHRYGQALAYDPENGEARRGLASLHWEKFRDAELRRDPRDTRYFRKLVEQYDDGFFARQLEGAGSLQISVSPSGAEVFLATYQEVDLTLQTTAEERIGVAPFQRVALPMGSHVLRVSHPLYRSAMVPIFLDRCQDLSLSVALRTAEELGEGMIFIPGGPFRCGGDPHAISGLERGEVELGDFAISRFPVTFREYLEFVNSLVADDPVVAQFRVPRSRIGGDAWFTRGADGLYFIPDVNRNGDPVDPLQPVSGVSWADAAAYSDWRSLREGAVYRLPRELEWEKASRGPDGRYFPWGDRFDSSFCKTEEARRRRPMPEAVGIFGMDSSPYGVRDLAGGVREWCTDPFDTEGRLRVVRGGAWNLPRVFARSCSRYGEPSEQVDDNLGFRVVREL